MTPAAESVGDRLHVVHDRASPPLPKAAAETLGVDEEERVQRRSGPGCHRVIVV